MARTRRAGTEPRSSLQGAIPDKCDVLVVGDYRIHSLYGVEAPPGPTEFSPPEDRRGAEQYWQRRYRLILPGGAILTKNFIEHALGSSVAGLSLAVKGLAADEASPHTQLAYWEVASHKTIDRGDETLRLSNPYYQVVTPTRVSISALDVNKLALLVLDDLGLSFRTTLDDGGAAQPGSIGQLLSDLDGRVRNEPAGSPSNDILILASIANKLPDLSAGVWRHLYTQESLRDATVVVLAAEDLRLENFRISTSVSWERAAQDLVTEFRENKRLIPFTRFRHIIVTFGITGALHVHRPHHEAEPRFTLLFDPNHDDTAFINSETYGYVLGYPAIHLGCLSKAYFQSRNTARHRELFDALITTTISESLSRCQLLYNLGYGKTKHDASETIIRGVPPQVFEESWPIRNKSGSRYPETVISESTVPLGESSEWTILHQSAAGQTNDIAEDIVLHGVDYVLNQKRLDLQELKTSLCFALGEAIENTLDDLRVLAHENLKAFPSQYNSQLDACTSEQPRVAEDGLTGPCSIPELKQYLSDLWNLTLTSWFRRADIFGWRPAGIKRDVTIFVLRAMCGNEAQGLGLTKCHKLLRSPPASVGRPLIASVVAIVRALGSRDVVSSCLATLRERLDKVELSVEVDLEDCLPSTRAVVAPIGWFRSAGTAASSARPLPVIDRREIEGHRTLQNLIARHLDQLQEGSARPLSVAVFGPPGSGKSSAIKTVVYSVKSDAKELKILNFNLAQFVDIRDLDNAFEQIVDGIAEHKIPIAFFDEFDTRLGTEELGWLKYFLAPMEDGRFKDRPVGDAILVFAGGTSETFLDFSRSGRATSDSEWVEFSRAKGPDFVSRLRGHLDIQGINPTGNHDNLYLLRRAVMLRSMLERMQKLNHGDIPVIDHDLLRALLHVPRYRHGGRSLRMALELVSDGHGHIRKSFIPSLGQLNMHLDGKAFLDFLGAPYVGSTR